MQTNKTDFLTHKYLKEIAVIKKIINWFKKRREDKLFKKKLKELRKRDPFIYK